MTGVQTCALPICSVDAVLEALPNLDAVDITTEPRLHGAIASRFLEAGVHVLVEKPMALTVSQCNQMERAAKRAGRVLCVAENYRFDPLVRLTRALLDVGAIGKPTLLLDHSVGSGGRIVITPWRHKRLYGGTLLDVGVHNVDLMAYYLGRIETVNAKVALLYLDLDNFKHINDALGHRMGDDVLVAVAKTLNEVTGGKNHLAQIHF